MCGIWRAPDELAAGEAALQQADPPGGKQVGEGDHHTASVPGTTHQRGESPTIHTSTSSINKNTQNLV